jgi:tRNA dimethylallyltransferase
LYQRINQRVDQMLKAGLEEEARSLYPHRHLNALQTVGYQELFDYFAGDISREEAIELIKRNSRRYAKRQSTWMRRDGFWKTFSPDQFDAIIHYLQYEERIVADS